MGLTAWFGRLLLTLGTRLTAPRRPPPSPPAQPAPKAPAPWVDRRAAPDLYDFLVPDRPGARRPRRPDFRDLN